jgi:hypothetical protein
MPLLEHVRASSRRSWTVAVGAYLLAAAASIALRSAAGGTQAAAMGSAWLMSAALVVTALVLKSPTFPRWSLLTAAAVMAAGLTAPVLVWPHAAQGGWHPLGSGGYGWLYIIMLGTGPISGPRWCHSPWAAVVGSLFLAAGQGAAGGMP